MMDIHVDFNKNWRQLTQIEVCVCVSVCVVRVCVCVCVVIIRTLFMTSCAGFVQGERLSEGTFQVCLSATKKVQQQRQTTRQRHIHHLSCHARRKYEYRVDKKLVKKRGGGNKRGRSPTSSASEDDAPKTKAKSKGKASAAPRETAPSDDETPTPAEAPPADPGVTPGGPAEEEEVDQAAAGLAPLAVAAAKVPKARVTMTALTMKVKDKQLVTKNAHQPGPFSGGNLPSCPRPPPCPCNSQQRHRLVVFFFLGQMSAFFSFYYYYKCICILCP